MTKPTGLDLLREPFPPNAISKLPKPTKAQTDEVRANFKAGIRCDVCGQWHHPKVVHLDYVGHAALTDRLLDADPAWNWEPLSLDEHGQPVYQGGGMWIKLTVCGVTRLGFGDADGKKGGNAVKEIIGDALRNAAMRFGAALDLWHKGDLHADDDTQDPEQERDPVAIADSLITIVQKQHTADALAGALSKPKFIAAEEWLGANNQEQAARLDVEITARKQIFAAETTVDPDQGKAA